MVQKLDTLQETPSQTAGPYVHIGLVPDFAGIPGIYEHAPSATPFPDGTEGTPVTIRGTVRDGTGTPLCDVLIETWQAGPDGRFGPGTRGFARFAGDADTGEWELHTFKPGALNGQAPHIAFWIVARGINIGLQTRLYFPGDDHGGDPVLSRVEQHGRAGTLIARDEGDGTYRFDIRLQGEAETVFLDI